MSEYSCIPFASLYPIGRATVHPISVIAVRPVTLIAGKLEMFLRADALRLKAKDFERDFNRL